MGARITTRAPLPRPRKRNMAPTLKTFVTDYFRPEHIATLRPAGQEHYEYLLRVHLLPTFGDTSLTAVTPCDVQRHLATKARDGYSKQTITHMRSALTAVYLHAKMLGFCDGPPTAGVKCHGADAEIARSFSAAEVRSLFEAIPAPYNNLVRLLAGAGLRIGEALGLRWKYVNMTDQHVVRDGTPIPPYCLMVVQAYSRGRWGKPKTARSRRLIPMSSMVWAAMAEMCEQDSTATPESPVFRGRTGQPWDAANVAKRFLKPAGETIGCPWAHWHCFRHTAASLSDLDAVSRQKFLGHTSAAMTAHYTHPDLEMVRAGLERVS